MDAHALFDFQERQLPGPGGALGLPGLSDIFPPPLPTPTDARGRPGRIPPTSASVSSTSISSSSSASASSSSVVSSSASTSSTPQIVSTSSTPVVFTTLPASTHTVTAVQSSTPSSSATARTTAGASTARNSSFLQNKVLSGVVFGIVGVVGLILVVIALTIVLRRKRNRRLVEDAVSFDPVKMGAGEFRDTSSLEGGNGQGYGRPVMGQGQYARSSSSTGRASNGPEVRMTPPFTDYAPPPVSSSQQGYQYQNQYQSQYQSPSGNMSAYNANAGYPQQTQGYQGYDYDYNFGQQQQQAQYNSNNNTWSSKPATLAIPPAQTSGLSPVSPSELGDPYGGIATSPPAPTLDDVDRSRRRSKSSSTEIKFAPPTFQSNNRPNEMR